MQEDKTLKQYTLSQSERDKFIEFMGWWTITKIWEGGGWYFDNSKRRISVRGDVKKNKRILEWIWNRISNVLEEVQVDKRMGWYV